MTKMNPLILTVITVVVLSLGAYGQPPNPPSPETYWYNQTFDHFNSSDTRSFSQRFLVYSQYWNPNDDEAPIFFCPGGEADVMGGYQHNGFMFELAKWTNAFLLFPEHRFYGQSLPFSISESYKSGNIQKLTIEQAMEDYVSIIGYAKQKWNISDNAPLIAFGGSYPGDLVVYMRVQYPDVIDAGLASSAPVNYHKSLVPNGAFFEVITNDFAMQDPLCPTYVRKAFAVMAEKANSKSGLEWIQEKLQLCSSITSMRLVNLWIENAFATLGMGDYPYPLDGLPAYPMNAACSIMSFGLNDTIAEEDQGLLVTNLGKTVGLFYNVTGSLSCFNISEEYYPCADITGCGGGVGDPDAMSWDYQSCTQLVSNVDTNNVTDMFPPSPYNFTELTQYCLKTWDAVPQPNYTVNKWPYYNSSRLIFSNGALDPWWPGGAYNLSGSMYSIFINMSAHHLDLRGSCYEDPIPVANARAKESTIIRSWITDIAAEKKARLH